MLVIPDWWVWDFWLADDGDYFHLYFLQAPSSVAADDRHWNVCVGHARSRDLHTWEFVDTALTPSADRAFDDLATWTGSVIQDDDGLWHMFYTGLTTADRGRVQRVGVATSTDLYTWTKHSSEPLVVADPQWYDTFERSGDPEAWRDPWVMRDPDGDGWHMYITASARDGAADQRGVLAHATSHDLRTWTVLEPVTSPDTGFSQLEVPQVVVVDGRPLVLFSCLAPELAAQRRDAGEIGGVWAMRPEHLLGPYDPTSARRITDHTLYVGRVIQDRSGEWVMLAFHNEGADGAFVGWISDPIPWTDIEASDAPVSAAVIRS